jgi:hypothetical protein
MRKALLVIVLLAACSPASAQTWRCLSGAGTAAEVACAPNSPNCFCTLVQVPQVSPAPPVCPYMTFWNGTTCQVPATSYPIPPAVSYPYPYPWHPDWNHDHPDHPH